MYRTAPNHRRLAWRLLAGRVARVIAGAVILGAAALAAAGVAPGAAGTASAPAPAGHPLTPGRRRARPGAGGREAAARRCLPWRQHGLVVLGDGLAGERVPAELARRVLGHGRHGLVDAGAAPGADLGHDPLRPSSMIPCTTPAAAGTGAPFSRAR